MSELVSLIGTPKGQLACFRLKLNSALAKLTPSRLIKAAPTSHLRRDAHQHFIQGRIGLKESSKGLVSLATHPLPMLCRRLPMHLRQRCLNCLTPTGFGSTLGVHPGDDSTDDCGREGDYCRNDRPHRVTHRAILAWMWRGHNGLLGNLLNSQRSMGSQTISL